MSSEEIEEAILKEQIKDIDKHSPADIAAAFMQLYEKKLHRQIHALGKKELQRVLLHVAFSGLSNRPYALQTDDEKRAAHSFSEVINQRMIMQLQMEIERAEKASQVEQTEQSLIKGEENGSTTEAQN